MRHSLSRFLVLVSLLSLTAPAYAATAKKGRTAAKPAASAKSSPSQAFGEPAGRDEWMDYRLFPERYITGGVNAGLVGSAFGFGVTGSVMFRAPTSVPLWIGGETGFLYASNAASFAAPVGATNYEVSGSLKSIPLLATAVYELFIPELKDLKPYVGGAIGLSITPVSAELKAANSNSVIFKTSKTEYYFEAFVKPGMKFDNFFVEARVGFLKDMFLFLPTGGYVFQF